MGYDLSNSFGGYVRFSGSGWDLALAVARHYGWEPAGTARPVAWDDEKDGPWEAGYWMNAGQHVGTDDAAAMAIALQRAVDSEDFVEWAQRLVNRMNGVLVEQYPRARGDTEGLSVTEAERFRTRLANFAAFARQGQFVIE